MVLELVVNEEMRLRQFTSDDAETIFALIDRNREHLSQNGDVTASKYRSKEDVLRSIESPVNPTRLRLGIWVHGEYVGSVNLSPDADKKATEIGCYLGAEFTGNGYMTRALERLIEHGFENGFHEIYAKVRCTNAASKALCKRLGFVINDKRSDEKEIYFYRKHVNGS